MGQYPEPASPMHSVVGILAIQYSKYSGSWGFFVFIVLSGLGWWRSLLSLYVELLVRLVEIWTL